MSSPSETIELQPVPPPAAITTSQKEQLPLQIQSADKDSHRRSSGQAPPSERAVELAQRWNHPRINTSRLAAIFFAFIAFGMNDGSYGALLPYVHHTSYSSTASMYAPADPVDT